MKRNRLLTAAALAAALTFPAAAAAQVNVRVPFVRVQVGGPGVSVRAPFVNIFVPSSPRVIVVQEPEFVGPLPQPLEAPKPPLPKPGSPDLALPVPALPERVLTMDQFVQSFQPKAGNYEVTLLNPVTKQATVVRFSLPEGTPRRVQVSRQQIEFDYGPRRYVRIQFDRDGVEVTTR